MVQGEEEVEEEEVGERLAHREGRRRLAGQGGLEKLFLVEEEEFWLSCGETNGLPFKIPLLSWDQYHTLRYFTSCHVSHLKWS